MNQTERKIFRYLIQYKTEHDGNSPTFRQIMKACDISSTSVVSYNLQKMRIKGLIKIVRGQKGIEIRGGKWHYISPLTQVKLYNDSLSEEEIQKLYMGDENEHK